MNLEINAIAKTKIQNYYNQLIAAESQFVAMMGRNNYVELLKLAKADLDRVSGVK